MSLFFLTLALIALGVYLMPREEIQPDKGKNLIVDQSAMLYLQMKEAGMFQYEKFKNTMSSLGTFSGEKESIHLVLQFIAYLEGEPVETEHADQSIRWRVLSFLNEEHEPDSRMNDEDLKKLDHNTWIDLALLQQYYEKIDEQKNAAESSVELRFLEQHLKGQSKIASLVQLFSLIGLALIIQSLFRWKAFNKMKIPMFRIDSVSVPLKLIGVFLGVFFVLYMALQLLLSFFGHNVWVIFFGYVAGVALGWYLLRRILFTSADQLAEACGIQNMTISFQTVFYAVFGFSVLIFVSHMTMFFLDFFLWPLNSEANDQFLSQLMSTPLQSAMLMLLSCVIAPVFEELLFRGVILRSLSHSLPKLDALLWASLMFGLFHPLNFFPLIFILGFCLGVVYMRTKNMTAPILVHVMWNVLTLLQIHMGV
jgi:membrane protease YdiL (CAAX protease family)